MAKPRWWPEEITKTGKEFATHETVRHQGGSYVNKGGFSTNNAENFFGVFKRGFRGTYSHCESQHLLRYLAEFAFRYANRKITDAERAVEALRGIEGKRLTCRRTDEAHQSQAASSQALATTQKAKTC